MSNFLMNAWYVAALSSDVQRDLKPVNLLSQAIVLYRRQDGRPVALEDACPHRKLPLSMGRIKGDAVECGYHGLTFDCAGKCIDAATQQRIPPFAVVHSYPVRDKYGLLWVWMGDPQQAAENEIFEIENYGNPAWHTTQGDHMPIACHYLFDGAYESKALVARGLGWLDGSVVSGPGNRDRVPAWWAGLRVGGDWSPVLLASGFL